MSTFVICFISCLVALFFLGGLLLTNIWAIVFVVSLVMTVLISVLTNQDARIEELEKRIDELQKEREAPLGQ